MSGFDWFYAALVVVVLVGVTWLLIGNPGDDDQAFAPEPETVLTLASVPYPAPRAGSWNDHLEQLIQQWTAEFPAEVLTRREQLEVDRLATDRVLERAAALLDG